MVVETVLLVSGAIALAVAWGWSHAYKKKWRREMKEKYPNSDGYSQIQKHSKKKHSKKKTR